MDTEHWNRVSFVIRSQYRQAVIDHLDSAPATPTQIKSDVPYPLSHISRSLGELRDEGMVRLLVSEEQRVGRLYALTETGEAVWKTAVEEGIVETTHH